MSQVEHLLHGKERSVHGDAGYIGADKRVPAGKRKREWHIAQKRKRAANRSFGEKTVEKRAEIGLIFARAFHRAIWVARCGSIRACSDLP